MELLDCWDARLSDDSVLEIRGENLFSGYLENHSNSWDFIRPMDGEGWFSTGDRIQLSGRILQVTGRSDSMVKVLGERVELDLLQARLESIAGKQVAVSAVADERRGYQLVLVYEEGVSQRDVLDRYNQEAPGPERIGDGFEVKKIPRNALGKLRRGKIGDIVNARRRGVPES
jgi:acyl-CoA synthetase (AMP-forming)/AMP-acid ligase II